MVVASGRRFGVATGPYVWATMPGGDFGEPDRSLSKFLEKEADARTVDVISRFRQLPIGSAISRQKPFWVDSVSRLLRISGWGI